MAGTTDRTRASVHNAATHPPSGAPATGGAAAADALQHAVAAYGRAMQPTASLRLRRWNDLRLTTTQLYLLSLLLDRDARSVGELAEEMGVSPATMTGLTDRLVRQRYIARQTDPDDRRIVRIVLTQAGRQVFEEPAPPADLHGTLAQLGPAKAATLAALLDELAAARTALPRPATAPSGSGGIPGARRAAGGERR